MRKRLIKALCSILIVGSGIVTLVGCKLSGPQVETIVQNTGFVSAITWIAKENPDRNAKQFVVGTIGVITQKVNEISRDLTYTAVIYPEIESQIETLVPLKQYRPLVLGGSLIILNGIDVLFVINPSWQNNEELAVKIVKSFCRGTQLGLLLADNDPIIEEATALSLITVKVSTQKR